MAIRLVITDMDNTLYSWVDYIVPCIEAMIESLCRTTGFPKIRVVQSLKEVYERYESNEYPFAIQESKIFAEFNYDFDSFHKLVIDPAREAFAQARKKYLHPYPRVPETLAALKERGIAVAALTDAPRNPAEGRARNMGLDEYIDSLYTLPSFPFPQSGVDARIRRRDEAGHYRASCKVIELPRDHEKPDPRGMLRIFSDFGVEPGEVVVVGDSRTKDVALSRSLGAVDCWAEYGTYVSVEYRERLDTISARSVTRRHLQHAIREGDAPPTHRISNFEQVLEIVAEGRTALPSPERPTGATREGPGEGRSAER
jgi:FMN phosphatase YigB (HAD superfamily)